MCLFLLVLSYQLIPCLHRKKPLPTNRPTRIPLAPPPPEPERPVVRAIRGAFSKLLTFLRRPFSSHPPSGGNEAQKPTPPRSFNLDSQAKPDRQHIREKFATQLRLNLHIPPAAEVLAPRSPGPRTPRDKKRYAILDDSAYADLDEGHFLPMEKPQSARLSPWSPHEPDYPYASSPTPSRKTVFDYGPDTPPPPFSPPPAYVAGTPIRAGLSPTPAGTPLRAVFSASPAGTPTRPSFSTSPPARGTVSATPTGPGTPAQDRFSTATARTPTQDRFSVSSARTPTQDRFSTSATRSPTRGLRPLLLRGALALSRNSGQLAEDPFADTRSASPSSMLSVDPFAAKSPLSSPKSSSFAIHDENPFNEGHHTFVGQQDAADPFVDRSPSALVEEDPDAAMVNLSDVVVVREHLSPAQSPRPSSAARNAPVDAFVIADDTDNLDSIRSSVSSTWSALTLEEPM